MGKDLPLDLNHEAAGGEQSLVLRLVLGQLLAEPPGSPLAPRPSPLVLRLVLGQLLAEPAHGPVQVVQLEGSHPSIG